MGYVLHSERDGGMSDQRVPPLRCLLEHALCVENERRNHKHGDDHDPNGETLKWLLHFGFLSCRLPALL